MQILMLSDNQRDSRRTGIIKERLRRRWSSLPLPLVLRLQSANIIETVASQIPKMPEAESRTEHANNTSQGQKRKHRKASALLELVLVAILSASTFYEYLHNAILQSYVKSAIESNAPILQFALPVGAVAIGGSLFLQRRRDTREAHAAILREQILANMRFGDAVLPHADTLPHHQMMFERPAREKNFVVRRTNKKGRLSRIHGAQKLPHEESA